MSDSYEYMTGKELMELARAKNDQVFLLENEMYALAKQPHRGHGHESSRLFRMAYAVTAGGNLLEIGGISV